MRPLTEDETRQVFEKLHKYLGKAIKNLVERSDEPYCFRLQRNRVFYVREDVMRRATNVSEGEGDGAGQACVAGPLPTCMSTQPGTACTARAPASQPSSSGPPIL